MPATVERNVVDFHVNLSYRNVDALRAGPTNNNKAVKPSYTQNDLLLGRIRVYRGTTDVMENVQYPVGTVLAISGIQKRPIGTVTLFSGTSFTVQSSSDDDSVWYEGDIDLDHSALATALVGLEQLDVIVNIQIADAVGLPATERATIAAFDATILKDAHSDAAPIDGDLNQYVPAEQYREYVIGGLLIGDASDERIFGYFKADRALKVIGMIVEAQDSPTGASLQTDIVRLPGNTEQARVVTVADGGSYVSTSFSELALAQNDEIRLKIKQVGSTTPGGNVSVRLICKL